MPSRRVHAPRPDEMHRDDRVDTGSTADYAPAVRTFGDHGYQHREGVRLQVGRPLRNPASGTLTPHSEIDHAMFVLNVDLWSADAQHEVNLVRHSATSPSISSTTPISYARVESSTVAYAQILPTAGSLKFEPGHPQQAPYNPYPGPPQVNPYPQPPGQGPSYGGAPQYAHNYAPTTNGPPYQPQNGYTPAPQPLFYATAAQIHAAGAPQPGMNYPSDQGNQLASYPNRPYQEMGLQRMPVSSTAPSGMFTRNLIGSLAASAFRLTDPDDRIGIWFVLQDLSVRTEGTFR